MKKLLTIVLAIAFIPAIAFSNNGKNPKEPTSQVTTYYVENYDGGGQGCDYTVTIKVKIVDGMRAYWDYETKTISFGDTESFTFIYDAGESITQETAIVTYSGGSNMNISDIRDDYSFDDACLDGSNWRYDTIWLWLGNNSFKVYQDLILGDSE